MPGHEHHLFHRVVEREETLLRNEGRKPRRLAPGQTRDVAAEHLDAARAGLGEPGGQPQQGRFARAVRADDAEELALLDRKTELLEQLGRAIPEPDRRQLERLHSRLRNR